MQKSVEFAQAENGMNNDMKKVVEASQYLRADKKDGYNEQL